MEVPQDDDFGDLFGGSTKDASRMTKQSLEEALEMASKLRASYYQDQDNYVFVDLTQRYEDMDDTNLLLKTLNESKKHRTLTEKDIIENEAFIKIALSRPDHDDYANNRYIQFSYGRFRTIDGDLKGQCGFGYGDPKTMLEDTKKVFQNPPLFEEKTPIYITVPASISPQLIDQKIKETLQSKPTVVIVGTVRQGQTVTIPFETIDDLRRFTAITKANKSYRPLQEHEVTDGRNYIQARTIMLPEDRDYGTIELRRGQFTADRLGLVDMEGKPITPKEVNEANKKAIAQPQQMFTVPMYLICYET